MVTVTITALLQWLLRIKSQLLTKARRPCVHLPAPRPQCLGLWPSASSTQASVLSQDLCTCCSLCLEFSVPKSFPGQPFIFLRSQLKCHLSREAPQTTDQSSLYCPGKVVPASCCLVPRPEMVLCVIWLPVVSHSAASLRGPGTSPVFLFSLISAPGTSLALPLGCGVSQWVKGGMGKK